MFKRYKIRKELDAVLRLLKNSSVIEMGGRYYILLIDNNKHSIRTDIEDAIDALYFDFKIIGMETMLHLNEELLKLDEKSIDVINTNNEYMRSNFSYFIQKARP